MGAHLRTVERARTTEESAEGSTEGSTEASAVRGSTPLDPETASLVRLSAALATRDDERIRDALEGALVEARPEAVEEILLQSYLFLGFPAALGGLALWREVSGRPASKGEGGKRDESTGVDRAVGADEAVSPDDVATRVERGERICRIVYGGRYEALRRNIRALHPEMERWMLEEGYGKVLGRETLELSVRELAIAALLAVLGTPVQLHSHLRGALNAGAGPDEVEVALEEAEEYQTGEERRIAREVWSRVRRR